MREIPVYLDDPQQLLFWEFDEFILLALAFGIGLMINFLSVLVITGLIGIKFYRRIKDRQAAGFLLHIVYWHLGLGGKDTYPTSRPLSFIRDFF